MAISQPDQAISAQAAALHDHTDYCYKSLSQSFLPQCRPLDLLYLPASRPLQPAPPLSALRMIASLHIGTTHGVGAGRPRPRDRGTRVRGPRAGDSRNRDLGPRDWGPQGAVDRTLALCYIKRRSFDDFASQVQPPPLCSKEGGSLGTPLSCFGFPTPSCFASTRGGTRYTTPCFVSKGGEGVV